MLLKLFQVKIRLEYHVDSFLKFFVVGQSHVDLLCKHTIAMLVWMNKIKHRAFVLHLKEFFSVNDVIHGNTSVHTDFLNQSSNIGLGFYP